MCAAVQRGGKSYFGTGKSFKFFWNKRLKEACTPDEEETSKSLILFKSIFLLHLFKSTEKKIPNENHVLGLNHILGLFQVGPTTQYPVEPNPTSGWLPGPRRETTRLSPRFHLSAAPPDHAGLEALAAALRLRVLIRWPGLRRGAAHGEPSNRGGVAGEMPPVRTNQALQNLTHVALF